MNVHQRAAGMHRPEVQAYGDPLPVGQRHIGQISTDAGDDTRGDGPRYAPRVSQRQDPVQAEKAHPSLGQMIRVLCELRDPRPMVATSGNAS